MSQRIAAALLAVAALGASAAPRAADEWALIWVASPDNRFPADELPAKPAPGGFALAVVNGLWTLVPAELQVKAPKRANKDDIDLVTLVATPPGAPFYVRATGLAAGKVDTPDMKFKDVMRDLFHPVALPFKGAPWAFEIRSGAVWFTDGKLHQKIYDALPADETPDQRDMEWARVLWVGDLDRDGKLDFIVDRGFDDGGRTCLWLSSRAKPGELAGEAGCQDHNA